jgi:hypothetical protein
MIQLAEYILEDDNGVKSKFAVLRTTTFDVNALNQAVDKYVGNSKHCQFVDITFMDPWTRVIIDENINNLEYDQFDGYEIRKKRQQKINILLK